MQKSTDTLGLALAFRFIAGEVCLFTAAHTGDSGNSVQTSHLIVGTLGLQRHVTLSVFHGI